MIKLHINDLTCLTPFVTEFEVILSEAGNEGIVLITVNGTTNVTVCNDGITDREATVICRELGYE